MAVHRGALMAGREGVNQGVSRGKAGWLGRTSPSSRPAIDSSQRAFARASSVRPTVGRRIADTVRQGDPWPDTASGPSAGTGRLATQSQAATRRPAEDQDDASTSSSATQVEPIAAFDERWHCVAPTQFGASRIGA
jgi:hypothetical protein